MPASCSYSVDNNILYCMVEGVVTIDDFKQLMLEIVSSTEYPVDVKTLWDIRKLDLSSITRELADQLISLREKNPQRGATSIAIVAEENHGFGMSRMYEMLSSQLPQQIMVFRDYKAGETWLMEQA